MEPKEAINELKMNEEEVESDKLSDIKGCLSSIDYRKLLNDCLLNNNYFISQLNDILLIAVAIRAIIITFILINLNINTKFSLQNYWN